MLRLRRLPMVSAHTHLAHCISSRGICAKIGLCWPMRWTASKPVAGAVCRSRVHRLRDRPSESFCDRCNLTTISNASNNCQMSSGTCMKTLDHSITFLYKQRMVNSKALMEAHVVPFNGLSPKFTTILGWCGLSGMSRTGTYYALGRGDLKAIKVGGRTLVDVERGLDWLRSQPPVQIRATKAA